MKKLICKIFDHKFRWVIAYEKIICIRCGEEYPWTISEWIDNEFNVLKSI